MGRAKSADAVSDAAYAKSVTGAEVRENPACSCLVRWHAPKFWLYLKKWIRSARLDCVTSFFISPNAHAQTTQARAVAMAQGFAGTATVPVGVSAAGAGGKKVFHRLL